jgi:dihydrofolate reductase
MNITLIVAAAEDNAIGKNNRMLWHLRADMHYFKNTTWGMPVIMGRKTFESLGKPLAGRENIVITKQANWIAPGVEVANSLSDALILAEKLQTNEVFVIGGGQVYAESLPLAHNVLLTRVHASFSDADVHFPELDGDVWSLTKATQVAADAQNDFACTFEVWERQSKI